MLLPCLLLGDHPALPSGLGRILRDLAQHLADDPALDLDIRIVGCRPGGMGEDGMPWRDGTTSIPVWSFLQSADDQALEIAQQVHLAWSRWWPGQRGIVLAIWDAHRLRGLVDHPGPWDLWAYLPVDAAMIGGGYAGDAARVVQACDRVIAYGGYGHSVLKSVRQPIPFLPHGLAESWWQFEEVPKNPRLIGCVMTNQPRKDWATALLTIRELRQRGHRVKLWAHVDRLVGSWDLPALVAMLGLSKVVEFTGSDQGWGDRELRRAYQQCGVTMLPSLGEGMGYPIIESLACGVPCVHTTFGGGAEWIPRPEWKVPERGRRVEGNGLERPVLAAADFANAIERVWQWQAQWEDAGAGYCKGAVANLRWDRLWGYWRSWIVQGLEARE